MSKLSKSERFDLTLIAFFCAALLAFFSALLIPIISQAEVPQKAPAPVVMELTEDMRAPALLNDCIR